MKKILYVVSNLRKSGPTTVLYNLIKNLDRDKFLPVIVTVINETEKTRIDDFRKLNVEIFTLGLTHKNFLFISKKKIKRLITPYAPDIVHSHSLYADYLIARIEKYVKHISTIHSYVYEDYISKHGILLGLFMSLLAMQAIKRTDRVICCSYSLRKKYEKKSSKNMYVIQNGFDFDMFDNRSNLTKQELHNELKLHNDKMVFIMVGSLSKRKDPLTVIKAFLESKYSSNGLLVILGDGDLYTECLSYLNDNILILGYMENVVEYYMAADVFVSASISEGLPNTVLEAGAFGLKMILSDIPEHKEIFGVIPQNDDIKFFEVCNICDCKRCFSDIRDNETHSYVISQHIRENFSAKKMTVKYEELYNSL